MEVQAELMSTLKSLSVGLVESHSAKELGSNDYANCLLKTVFYVQRNIANL